VDFCFVDIGGIVDHHYLNFLFIISLRTAKSNGTKLNKNDPYKNGTVSSRIN